MHDEIRFRLAVPTDRVGILAFQRAAVARVKSGHYAPEILAAWRRCPASGLDELIWSGRYLLAVAGRRPVAGAGWEPATEAAIGVVRAVFVHPAHAGRRLGRALMARVEAAMMQAGRHRAVAPAALDAVPFYETLGYRTDGGGSFDLGSVRLPYRRLVKDLVPGNGDALAA
jgi:putative acetyltransferase